MSHVPTLGLHDDSFGPHLITSSVDEKSTWNSTWQVCIMLARIVKKIFRTTLEGRLDKICGMNLHSHLGLVTFERLWTVVHGLLYKLILKVGYHDHLGAMTNAF
jgi:hypothetical protein